MVAALLEAIGAEGTLLVPTFTHSGTTHFDPLTSPSKVRRTGLTQITRFGPAQALWIPIGGLNVTVDPRIGPSHPVRFAFEERGDHRGCACSFSV